MPASRDQIYTALQAADKAGNTADARQLAQLYASTPADAPAPAAAKPATLMDTIGRAVTNLPGDAMDTVKNLASTAEALSPFNTDIATKAKIAQGIGSTIGNAANIFTGGLQRVRNLSPAAQQGSAPAMDTSAADAAVADLNSKYGSKQAIYKTVGDHPVGTALALAGVVDPALKAAGLGEGLAGIAGAAGSKLADTVGGPLNTITGAETRAKAAASTMRGATQDTLNQGQSTAQAGATAAQAQADRAATLAAQSRASGNTLNTRQVAAAAQAAPPVAAIGDGGSLSDIGQSLRDPAMAKQAELDAQMKAADDQHRAAMQEVTDDREASGVGVSDSPSAKILIQRAKNIVEPNPVTRPSVGNTPLSSAGGKLNQDLLDVLQPKEVPLTVDEAKQLTQQGVKVNTAPDGSFTRTIKPSMENVDNFRRFVGQVAQGNVEGYGSINKIEANTIYSGLSKALDEHAEGTAAPVQQSYKLSKQALAPFDNMRMGQSIVGTQAGTDGVASVPAANIPQRMIAGGRDTVQQTASVAGQPAVSAALRNLTQNAIAGSKTSDATAALIGPGTKLGDAISTEPDIVAAAQEHINNQKMAEAAGTQADSLASRTATVGNRSSTLDTYSDKYSKIASQLNGTANDYSRKLAALEIADPAEVGSHYTDMLNDAHKAGQINDAQYSQGLQLAKSAANDFKLKATRDKWLKTAASVVGVGALGKLGINTFMGSH